jgi:hypothetical protein
MPGDRMIDAGRPQHGGWRSERRAIHEPLAPAALMTARSIVLPEVAERDDSTARTRPVVRARLAELFESRRQPRR